MRQQVNGCGLTAKELTPYITYQGGVLYGLTSDHKPYALNAKTGKAKWQSGTSTWIDTVQRAEALIPTADTLYVIKGSTTFALDIQSGKLRWKADEPLGEGHGTEYLEESNGIVLRTFFVQGALTSVQLNAYDKKTGKKLWGHFGQGKLFRSKTVLCIRWIFILQCWKMTSLHLNANGKSMRTT
ncbi:PQQ-binding-like beta-propeller repeat protein [Paenibacillus amylolyticus]|nr:PQQ-binding-like beta-propeller repeat protein [Paenibacillus amylolyticus]